MKAFGENDLFNVSDGFTPPLESAESSSKRKRPEGSDQGVGQPDGCNKRMIRLRLSYSSVPSLDHPESISRNETKDSPSPALMFCEKVRKVTNSEQYLVFLRCLHYYGTGKITEGDMMKMMTEEFPEFEQDFRQVLEFYESLTQPSLQAEDKGKKHIKSSTTQTQLDELTPSYRVLPKNLSANQISSGSEPDDLEVLNNCCYSKGLFNSGKVGAKDPCEEMLNECEDELYERDMVVEWLRSTKERAAKLLEAISEGKIKETNPDVVDSYFTRYNLRFIERVYGDIHGPTMADELHQAAEIVLPFIIKRLDQIQVRSSFSYQSNCRNL
ncbi:Uncharacterized protein TCM_017328 [Theobroma cacao]|uniref:Histone deacetylase interacting domain-containing protein n=1 Tax=Theobroma cacao TaxID=3641 RepID=A0A061EDB9_THECC|nr:Uncharacterized protein TCM_017328 [Theobroma cacao]